MPSQNSTGNDYQYKSVKIGGKEYSMDELTWPTENTVGPSDQDNIAYNRKPEGYDPNYDEGAAKKRIANRKKELGR